VVNSVRGNRGGHAFVVLDQTALSLLHKGENRLAVFSSSRGVGSNLLDVGLVINRVALEKRTLPVLRPASLVLPIEEGTDNTLRVGEVQKRKELELQSSYHKMEIAPLLEELKNPVAYYRLLAIKALATKGLDGLKAAEPLLSHELWWTRLAALALMERVAGLKDKKAEETTYLNQLLPVFIKMLRDPLPWVRAGAAKVLGNLGEPARAAIPDLIEMVKEKKLAGFAVENGHKGEWPDNFDGNIFVPAERAHYTKEADERVLNQWVEGIIGVITGEDKYRLV